MVDPNNGKGLIAWKKVLIGILIPVILLFISATFNVFQAGAASKLSSLESAVKDIGDIKLDVGVMKSQITDLREAVKENGEKLDAKLGSDK